LKNLNNFAKLVGPVRIPDLVTGLAKERGHSPLSGAQKLTALEAGAFTKWHAARSKTLPRRPFDRCFHWNL